MPGGWSAGTILAMINCSWIYEDATFNACCAGCSGNNSKRGITGDKALTGLDCASIMFGINRQQ